MNRTPASIFVALSLALCAGASARAQSTAQPMIPGTVVNPPAGGCATGQGPCFQPYGESGPAFAQVAVPSGTHNAGASLGGLIQIAIGPQAIITGLGYKSEAGSTSGVMVRAWTKLPVNTTCADGSSFSGSNADDLYRVVGTPTATLAPSAPASTTGDSSTYADQTGLTWSIQNKDSPQKAILYVCVVATANDTTDPGHNIDLVFAGPLP